MAIKNTFGAMKIWEEAFFCLSQDSDVVQAYFKWKHKNGNFDVKREKVEYASLLMTLPTSTLSKDLNNHVKERGWEYNPILAKFSWFTDPNYSRLYCEIELLRDEIRKRPTEKQSKKEIRQERARQNRSHGKCKNR